MIEQRIDAPRPLVEVSVDGAPVAVPEGRTVLDACRAAGGDLPTLCYLETLTPVNACRVCVVEVEGSRTLVPACSRAVEPGMVIATGTDRVLHSRRLVFELLASSVDLSLVDAATRQWMEASGVDGGRFGEDAADVSQPVKVQDDLYVRDYERCILCYKCVEACGDDAQNTFAIAIAGRGFSATVSTEYDVVLPESACVYCGNCIGVCPTGALMGKVEHDMRADGTWDEGAQTETRTVCPFCGVGCNLDLTVQDNRIVRATSPRDHSVTSGHLCIKGRFGWDHVQS
jgi:predicted molibdopterin-dependent oxidoreductase YjgC